jgi:hypothetical protein
MDGKSDGTGGEFIACSVWQPGEHFPRDFLVLIVTLQ